MILQRKYIWFNIWKINSSLKVLHTVRKITGCKSIYIYMCIHIHIYIYLNQLLIHLSLFCFFTLTLSWRLTMFTSVWVTSKNRMGKTKIKIKYKFRELKLLLKWRSTKWQESYFRAILNFNKIANHFFGSKPSAHLFLLFMSSRLKLS